MTLKILYLIDWLESNYPRDQNYIVNYMSERGHDVTVLTSTNKYMSYDRRSFPNVLIKRRPILGSIRRAIIYEPSRDVFRRYDVLHAFTFFTFSSLLGVYPRATVRVIRSEIGPPHGENFQKARKSQLYRSLTFIYKKFYIVTVYNKVEREALVALGFDPGRILEIPPMIDYDLFSRLKRASNADEVVIGTIARISPEKGVHRLIPMVIRLLREMRDPMKGLRLVVAGRIDDPAYGHWLSRLRDIMGNKFTYLGEVASPYDFYRMVDVVIVPSLVETGAITVLEAMAAGKIVIASDIYPINTYIKHRFNGFLFKNEEEAAQIIKDVLEGVVNVKSISARAQEYATRHDYRIICRKLELAYHRSLDRKE